jgi:deoxyhypusine synthase
MKNAAEYKDVSAACQLPRGRDGKRRNRLLQSAPLLDWTKLKRTSLLTRPSLVHVRDFARPLADGRAAAALIGSMPRILAGRALRDLIGEIVRAHRNGRPVVMAVGGHVIKVGLGPILVDLIRRDVVRAVAMNGGAAIHDYEIALCGKTSEDVGASLGDGSFGMARETIRAFAQAARTGMDAHGLGEALGQQLLRARARYRKLSVLAHAAAAAMPLSVHLAIGTDITHMAAEISGAELGESTMIDFRRITEVVAELDGGVWINVGSAVVLPEVFLKALSVCRNLTRRPRRFTTANLDMIQHYRPAQNVLKRPGGKAISIVGHHEITLPLLHAGILAGLSGARL